MNPTLPPFVQEQFDRGADPLDDPRCQQWLLDNPQHLEAFAAMQRTLHQLPAPSAAPVAPHRWRLLPFLAATAALLLGALALASLWAEPAAGPVAPLPRPEFASEGGVVYCRVATTQRDGTRGQQRAIVTTTPAGGRLAGLPRRDLHTLSTFSTLPAGMTPWSVATITEQRALLP